MQADYTIRNFQCELIRNSTTTDITDMVDRRLGWTRDIWTFGDVYKASGSISFVAPYGANPIISLNPRSDVFRFERGATINWSKRNTQGAMTLMRSAKILEFNPTIDENGETLELTLGCRLALLDIRGRNQDNVTGTNCENKITIAAAIEAIATEFAPTLDITFDLGNLPTTPLVDYSINITGSKTPAQAMQELAGMHGYVLWDNKGTLQAVRYPLYEEYVNPNIWMNTDGWQRYTDVVQQPEIAPDIIYADGVRRFTSVNDCPPIDDIDYGPWLGVFPVTIEPGAFIGYGPDFFNQVVPVRRIIKSGCPRDGRTIEEIRAMRGNYWKIQGAVPETFRVSSESFLRGPLQTVLSNPDDLGLKLRTTTDYTWDSLQNDSKLLKKVEFKESELGGAIANLVAEPSAIETQLSFLQTEVIFERVTTEYTYNGQTIAKIKTTTELLFTNALGGFSVFASAIAELATYIQLLTPVQVVEEIYEEIPHSEGKYNQTTLTSTMVGASQNVQLGGSAVAVQLLADYLLVLGSPFEEGPIEVDNVPATIYRQPPCVTEEERLSCEYAPPTTKPVPVERQETFDPIADKATLDRMAKIEWQRGKARERGFFQVRRQHDDFTSFDWRPFQWYWIPDPHDPTDSVLCLEESIELVPEDDADEVDQLLIAYAKWGTEIATQAENPVLVGDVGVPKLQEYAPQYLYVDVPITFPINVRMLNSGGAPNYVLDTPLPDGLTLNQFGVYGWITGTPTTTGVPTTTIRDSVSGATTTIQWAIARVGRPAPQVPTPTNPTPPAPETTPIAPVALFPEVSTHTAAFSFSTTDLAAAVLPPINSNHISAFAFSAVLTTAAAADPDSNSTAKFLFDETTAGDRADALGGSSITQRGLVPAVLVSGSNYGASFSGSTANDLRSSDARFQWQKNADQTFYGKMKFRFTSVSGGQTLAAVYDADAGGGGPREVWRVRKASGNTIAFELSDNGTSSTFVVANDGVTNVVFTTGVDYWLEWYFDAANDEIGIRLDGVFWNTTAFTNPVFDPTDAVPFTIGAYDRANTSSNRDPMNGRVEFAQFWPRVISEAESTSVRTNN